MHAEDRHQPHPAIDQGRPLAPLDPLIWVNAVAGASDNVLLPKHIYSFANKSVQFRLFGAPCIHSKYNSAHIVSIYNTVQQLCHILYKVNFNNSTANCIDCVYYKARSC